MKITIHQPNYLPRLKVLQKIVSADIWVVLDSVQFAMGDWQNRTKIVPLKEANTAFWMSLPVTLSNRHQTKIRDVFINNFDHVIEKHEKSIYHAFHSSKYWNELSNYWDDVKSNVISPSLLDISLSTTITAITHFARLPDIKFASDLPVHGKKSILMANICDFFEANYYLADTGSMSYLRTSDFNNTRVLWQRWTPPCPPLREAFPWRDISFLSFLAAHGRERLRDHLLSGVFSPGLSD